MLTRTLLSAAVLGLANTPAAFTFYQYWGPAPSDPKKCARGAPGDDLVDGHYFNLATGCQVDRAGKDDQSTKIKAANGDDALVAVFFSSNDCNPDSIIAIMDENTEYNGKEPGCFSGKYGSFEVWSVCEDDKLDCVN